MMTTFLLFGICIFMLTTAQQPIVIDLTNNVDNPTKIAVQICSGLYNRDTNNNGVYTIMNEPYDADWLQDLYSITNPTLTPIDTFITQCFSSSTAKGYILYNETYQEIIPNLITLASILNAVLLPPNSPFIANNKLVFDAITEWKGFNALQATKYMYTHYVNDTTTLAFMDATKQINPGLIDYIVKERIFNIWLSNACIRETPQYDFFLFMVNPSNNPWNNPINVMGYNSAWPVAGDLFEAETDCNALHNMGQIASDGFNNLAFFSRTPDITTPLMQNPSKTTVFNESKTYISFTIGDGDNLSYLKGSRRSWMLDRVSRCNESNYSYLGCFPLIWSISPHPLYIAPLMLEWYFNESYKTKNDWFTLPPSGHLYAYPSEMEYDTAQANFIKSTEEDCRLLSCNSSVAWEFVFTWFKAIKEYFPRYGDKDKDSEQQRIYGMFGVNVPFNVPVEEFYVNNSAVDVQIEFWKVLNNVVLFKPREWRGANHSRCDSGAPLDWENCLTVDQMAYEINSIYPKGTITHIYITSDGGFEFDNLYELVPKLEEHVQLVGPTELIDLVLQQQ